MAPCPWLAPEAPQDFWGAHSSPGHGSVSQENRTPASFPYPLTKDFPWLGKECPAPAAAGRVPSLGLHLGLKKKKVGSRDREGHRGPPSPPVHSFHVADGARGCLGHTRP